MGGERAPKPRHPRGDSYDESNNGIHKSLNHELLNESFKLEMRDGNTSLMYPMQPKLHGQSVKNGKKQANSIQSTPKKDQRGSHHFEEKPIVHEPKVINNLKVITSGNNYEKSRTHSQSPSKFNQVPKEPGYTKPRDSSVNPYRTKVQSRKSSRPAIQLTNGKAWRPSTNQAPSRERGRSSGLNDESFKVSNNPENSFSMGSGSFMLNSSFQKNMHDRSFDMHAHQPKAYAMHMNKRVSYGGESQKRGRNNFSPTNNVHKKNLQNLLNKSGIVNC
jgi:hypothetical protein